MPVTRAFAFAAVHFTIIADSGAMGEIQRFQTRSHAALLKEDALWLFQMKVILSGR